MGELVIPSGFNLNNLNLGNIDPNKIDLNKIDLNKVKIPEEIPEGLKNYASDLLKQYTSGDKSGLIKADSAPGKGASAKSVPTKSVPITTMPTDPQQLQKIADKAAQEIEQNWKKQAQEAVDRAFGKDLGFTHMPPFELPKPGDIGIEIRQPLPYGNIGSGGLPSISVTKSFSLDPNFKGYFNFATNSLGTAPTVEASVGVGATAEVVSTTVFGQSFKLSSSATIVPLVVGLAKSNIGKTPEQAKLIADRAKLPASFVQSSLERTTPPSSQVVLGGVAAVQARVDIGSVYASLSASATVNYGNGALGGRVDADVGVELTPGTDVGVRASMAQASGHFPSAQIVAYVSTTVGGDQALVNPESYQKRSERYFLEVEKFKQAQQGALNAAALSAVQ